ncbi:DsbA family oxidoreductase [Spirosoma sp. BT702]|uniref:DsbA family oxidoreductase n=1 Tax=Spirosoma profusum TaxID=2771354 RepID=A0A926Y0Q2_9BACT|nr:DsbA family oxidoreductase [Spirosoma profusum]MBD2701373.1 DsbA family oxidoreductase [Spirosoma profusum]
MEVEIWSDVMCPFCYIGKRKFEAGLAQFAHKEDVTITWKSFQLNPAMETDPSKNINQYLADIKGWSLEQAEQMNARVTDIAREVGLDYHFDQAIVANSWDAHRFIQLAKKHGLGDAAEERLFRAYFTEGKNTADHATLVELGEGIGLDTSEIEAMLVSDDYTDAVRQDVYEAQQLGVRGVPFFVINRRYAVSGAQQPETFQGALETAWAEWAQQNATLVSANESDATCTQEEGCVLPDSK